ncbi:hypothetical protein BKA65DRAFT_498650 [Rhexocercosporidium sp. MPI-PUGE-AT-0058]|nr:hypothetical protein BKA65DRAFT_498650 [Rhexocercosporidium sp. MPI-PUGE-AT-0058]
MSRSLLCMTSKWTCGMTSPPIFVFPRTRPQASGASISVATFNFIYAKAMSSQTQEYQFPKSRLKLGECGLNRTPLVPVLCDTFSPISNLHLQMFDLARDYARRKTQFEVIGGYLSPVSDAYEKDGLESAAHRLRVCGLAMEKKIRLVDGRSVGS